MTTFEPGASDVFTHGFTSSPASTAFFASKPAPSITYGFEVFVHDVIAAMTTAPWSRSNDAPSDNVTGTDARGRSAAFGVVSVAASGSGPSFASADAAGGSEAGNDSADATSAGV